MAFGFQSGGFQHLAWQQSDPVVTPPGLSPAGAPSKGGKALRDKIYLVEIDGKTYQVRDADEARQILEEVKARIEDGLRIEVPLAGPKTIKVVKPPKVKASPVAELRQVVKEFRRDISELYRVYAAASGALEAESLRRMADEMDDEAAIMALFQYH